MSTNIFESKEGFRAAKTIAELRVTAAELRVLTVALRAFAMKGRRMAEGMERGRILDRDSGCRTGRIARQLGASIFQST